MKFRERKNATSHKSTEGLDASFELLAGKVSGIRGERGKGRVSFEL